MAAIGRTLLFVLIALIGGAAAAYFFLPNKASRTETIQVSRPASAVYGFLANAPVGSELATGVKATKIVSADNNKVVAEVAFADGAPGTATFIVTPKGDNSEVKMTIDQPIGANPLNKIDALTGGKVGPLAEVAAADLGKDLNALPPGDPQGLPYELVTVAPKPFLYNENCSPQDAGEIKEAVAQSLAALKPLMGSLGIHQDGPPVAVETKWDDANKQYCFQIGYTYGGTARRTYVAKLGETPGGSAIKVHFAGAEENVLPTYDKMEALIAASRLTIGKSFEVYNDDLTAAAGGSVDRDIYYVVTGDTSALARVAPASVAAPPSAAPASAAPAPAAPPVSSAAPASAAP